MSGNDINYLNATDEEKYSPYQPEIQRYDPMVEETYASYQKGENILNRLRSAATTISELPNFIDTDNSLNIKREYLVLNPIYKPEYMNRCSNAYLFDDIVYSAINRLAYFTLGKPEQYHAILYPESIRPLRSELEAKNEIKKIKIMKTANDVVNSLVEPHLSDQEISQFENYIHYTNKTCHLVRMLQPACIGSHIFGRTGLYVELSKDYNKSLDIPAGSPIGLKTLKPMHLGRVLVDASSFNLKGIEYTDPKVEFREYVDVGVKSQYGGQQPVGSRNIYPNQGPVYDPHSSAADANTGSAPKFLPADRCVYFVRNNYDLMREDWDYFFGHSTLQPLMSMSEENRRLKQWIIPQLNQGHWAGSVVWKFPNWTNAQMKIFFKNIKPGGHSGVPQKDIEAQQLNFTPDYNGLIALNEMLKMNMLSVFGIPSFIMNIENANTKAVGESVVIGFNESTIQYERAWLTNILDEQYFGRLFRNYYPHDQFVHIKLKIISEFENISFETFFEKAIAVVSLIEKKVITLTEGRNMLKLPPLLPEDYAQLGLTMPMVDPALQGIPSAPNMVDVAMVNMQRKLMETNKARLNGQIPEGETTGTSQGESMFNSKINELKNSLVSNAPKGLTKLF